MRTVDGGVEIDVWVVPGASRSGVAGVHDGAVRVRVAQPAEAGKANRAVLDLVSRLIEAPVELVSGATSRRKRLRVPGADPASVAKALGL